MLLVGVVPSFATDVTSCFFLLFLLSFVLVFSLSFFHSHFGTFYRIRHAKMGNIAPSILSSFKVKFTREAPNDFYLSGDRVQGIIEIVTKDKDNDVNFKHGPLYVELIGKLKDCKTNSHQQRIATGVQIFFRQRAQVIKLPNDNQQMVRYSFKKNIFYRNKMFNIALKFCFSYQFRFVIF